MIVHKQKWRPNNNNNNELMAQWVRWELNWPSDGASWASRVQQDKRTFGQKGSFLVSLLIFTCSHQQQQQQQQVKVRSGEQGSNKCVRFFL